MKPALNFNRRLVGVRYWLQRAGRIERDQDAAIAAALRDVERIRRSGGKPGVINRLERLLTLGIMLLRKSKAS